MLLLDSFFVMSKRENIVIRISLFQLFSWLFSNIALVCTKVDLITIQGKVEKFNIVEQGFEGRQATKCGFKLITNVTIFAVLLKNIPMGCPNSVLPKPLLKIFSMLSFIG